MSLDTILFVLIKYLDYKSLINLSNIIKIKDYIWTRYLDLHYQHSSNPKSILMFLQNNSIKLKSKRRNVLKTIFETNYIDFDVSLITRLFSFSIIDCINYTYFIFSTTNLEYFEYSNGQISNITFDEILIKISKTPIYDRIKLDTENGYSLNQIKKFNYSVFKFTSHVIPRKLYHLNNYYTREFVVNVNVIQNIDLEINMQIIITHLYNQKFTVKQSLFPFKSLKVNNNATIIKYFNNTNIYYIYYEYNIIYLAHDKKKEYEFVIIARKELEDLINVLSKEQLNKLKLGI
jgi:hypothetical protein